MKRLLPSHLQTDHFTSHRAVLGLYERLFWPIHDSTDCILEIGTNDGGGIQMYANYFDRAEHCFAIDILPKPAGLTDPRIQFVQGDAYDKRMIENLKHYGGKFSLLVDDGSHEINDMVAFCKYYPDLLSENGIAIIEDIQEPHWGEDIAPFVPPGFCSAVVDLRHVNRRYDDLLLVIWRDGSKSVNTP